MLIGCAILALAGTLLFLLSSRNTAVAQVEARPGTMERGRMVILEGRSAKACSEYDYALLISDEGSEPHSVLFHRPRRMEIHVHGISQLREVFRGVEKGQPVYLYGPGCNGAGTHSAMMRVAVENAAREAGVRLLDAEYILCVCPEGEVVRGTE